MIQLKNDFRVALPVRETWELLTDLPKVARCLPGARLDEVVDGGYRGGLSAKIGPISATYQGTASFLELDEVAYRAVIAARGREEKGSGSASADITALLTPDGSGTRVDVRTELAISGRAAQFGRSLMAEVSGAMVNEFVRRLEQLIETGDAAAPAKAGPAKTGLAPVNGAAPGGLAGLGMRPLGAGSDGEPNQLDVGATLLLPMLRKAAAPIATAAVGCVLGVLVGKRLGRRGGGARGHVLAPEFGASSPLFRLVPADDQGSR